MSWMAGFLFRRYQSRRTMQHAAMADSAPPLAHPSLGLGGRSIELSIGRGRRPDWGAFDLAAAELHTHLMDGDWSVDELRAAGTWLRDLWPEESAADSLDQLRSDLRAMTP